jgi:hypothetical protein
VSPLCCSLRRRRVGSRSSSSWCWAHSSASSCWVRHRSHTFGVRTGSASPSSFPPSYPRCCVTSSASLCPLQGVASCRRASLGPYVLYMGHTCRCWVVPPSSSSFPPSSLSCRPSSVWPFIFVSSGSRLVLVAGSEALVREIGRGIAKTNHDKCRGSCFATHHRGCPHHQPSSSSSLPGSPVERD